MGCLFSSSFSEEEIQRQQQTHQRVDQQIPLLGTGSPRSGPRKGGDTAITFITPRGGSPISPVGASAIPVFSNSAAVKTSVSSGGRAASSVFCPCGGPGVRVKLLPCGHSALCLSCAQMEKACPACGTIVQDSVPSFRVARKA